MAPLRGDARAVDAVLLEATTCHADDPLSRGLSKFQLRLRIHPLAGVRNWSHRYFQWLRQVEFEHLADGVVFADYLGRSDRGQ